MNLLRSRRERLSGDRGAAAVEFAIVSLLLFLIVFGIIEFSLVMRDKIAVTSAVRTGGRLASATPKACDIGRPGCTITTATDPVTGTPAGTSVLVTDTVKAVGGSLTGIPKQSIKAIWVYQADANGNPPSGGFASCTGNCVQYTYDPTYVWTDYSQTPAKQVTGGFKYLGGSWSANNMNACPGDPAAQSVGVYLKVTHKFILGQFVSGTATIDLSDVAAFKFEPIPPVPGPCKGIVP